MSITIKNSLHIVSLLFCIGIALYTSTSCMSRKRCPGVHKYTTPQSAGSKNSKHSGSHYGGATTHDSRLKGATLRLSGGFGKERRESGKNMGTGAWTKKNKNKDKHKAKSGIIPPNLKKPPKAKKHKPSQSSKKAIPKKGTT